jgi:lactoylglutathione lyase
VKFLSVMPNLYAADVEASAAFYRDLLGGTETFRLPASGPALHVELRIGDVVLAVTSREEVEPQGLPAPSGGHPLELVVWCDSADEAVAALRAAGVPVLVEPQGGHVSGHRRAYVADPDGNWIALVSQAAGYLLGCGIVQLTFGFTPT